MIQDKTAVKISSEWHNGQWSALYSFASTGKYYIEKHLQYLQEIEDCLHPEYALYPGTLSKKDEKDLIALKEYFIYAGSFYGINTDYKQHPIYGYLIPFIVKAPYTVYSKINKLHYAI